MLQIQFTVATDPGFASYASRQVDKASVWKAVHHLSPDYNAEISVKVKNWTTGYIKGVQASKGKPKSLTVYSSSVQVILVDIDKLDVSCLEFTCSGRESLAGSDHDLTLR